MTKFNLKTVKLGTSVINEKNMDKQRDDMNLSNEKQKSVDKNINFSISKKDIDNTVPFNVQLEAARKNKEGEKIIESKMDKREISFGEKTEQVSPINRESQKYDSEKIEKFRKAQQDKDTLFWDNYVGVQMEGDITKVDKNVPSSQLQNNPDRFKGEKTKKMVSALKDADAMLFHIHASAKKEGRELNDNEKQQIVDINSGKARILSQYDEGGGKRIRRSIYQPIKGEVKLVCENCKKEWNERWGNIYGDEEHAICPKCGLRSFIGDEKHYD